MTSSTLSSTSLPVYPDILSDYINTGREDISVDFKREYNLKHEAEEVAKDICAIANSCELHGCGYIIVGVLDSDQREAEPDDPPIPGLNISMDDRKSFRSLVQNIGRHHVDPRLVIDVGFPLFSDVRIAIIKIIPHNRPYKVINTKTHNGIWIREGESCRISDAETAIDFFQEHLFERAKLEIITKISSKLQSMNSNVADIIDFLIDNINLSTPNALHTRAILFRRIENHDSASRDLSNAINLSPDWLYISLFTEINILPVKEKFRDMDINGRIGFDDFDLRDIETILDSDTRTSQEDDFIARVRQEIDRMQESIAELSSQQRRTKEILDMLDKTPMEQRDGEYPKVRLEVEELDRDIGQRLYQLEKRIKKALSIGL